MSGTSVLVLGCLLTTGFALILCRGAGVRPRGYDRRTELDEFVPEGCVFQSSLVGEIKALETQSYMSPSRWERQLRYSSLPHEIETRVRCTNWGEEIDTHVASCDSDQKYYVGSKRTMLAAMLGARPASFYEHANILIIGLGGGSQPMQLRSLFPNCAVTVVEIDEHVVEAAKTCFGLKTDENLKVVTEDATKFVQNIPPGTFDLVINDVVTNGQIAPVPLVKMFPLCMVLPF